MIYLVICTSIIFSLSVFFLLELVFSIPDNKAFSIKRYYRNKISDVKTKKYIHTSSLIKKIIKEDSNIYKKLKNDFAILNKEDDIYVFLSSIILPNIILFPICFACAFIIPFYFPLLIFFSIFLITIYPLIKVTKKADEIRSNINEESYDLVKYITNNSKNNSDIIYILSSYVSYPSSHLQMQLQSLISKSKTVNFAYAVQSFDSTVNTRIVSDICKGLNSAYLGEDMHAYFSSLQENLSSYILEEKEKKLSSLPIYIKLISIFSLIIFTGTYFAIMYNLISESISKLFF